MCVCGCVCVCLADSLFSSRSPLFFVRRYPRPPLHYDSLVWGGVFPLCRSTVIPPQIKRGCRPALIPRPLNTTLSCENPADVLGFYFQGYLIIVFRNKRWKDMDDNTQKNWIRGGKKKSTSRIVEDYLTQSKQNWLHKGIEGAKVPGRSTVDYDWMEYCLLLQQVAHFWVQKQKWTVSELVAH